MYPHRRPWGMRVANDEEQELDCAICCVRIRLWDVKASPKYGGCDEPRPLVTEEHAKPRLQKHPGELFGKGGADEPGEESAYDSVLHNEVVPDDGLSRCDHRHPTPKQMNQKGKIPKAQIDSQLTNLIAIDE